MFIKNKKEFLIAVILTLVVLFAIDIGGDVLLGDLVSEDIFSANTMLIGMGVFLVMLAIPFFIAMFFGYRLSKKGEPLKEVLVNPAAALAVAALLLTLFSVGTMMAASDEDMQTELAALEELEVDYFSEMSIADFRVMLLVSVTAGAVFLAVMYFGVGVAGSFAGKTLSENGKK